MRCGSRDAATHIAKAIVCLAEVEQRKYEVGIQHKCFLIALHSLRNVTLGTPRTKR
jgi:hypothetical protein